jgi:hypothetical protein
MLIDFLFQKFSENWNNLLRLAVLTNMQKRLYISILPEGMLKNAHFFLKQRVDN